MIQEDVVQFAEARLKGYLRSMLGGHDIGNGTPAADAVAVALAVDLRLSSAGAEGLQRILSLGWDEIVDVTVATMEALSTPGRDFALPLGTSVTAKEPGGILIGKEHWVLNADSAGLHLLEATGREGGGRNLELLHREIVLLTRNLACRRMGLPQPKHIVDSGSRHVLQFPPFPEAGGVALQRMADECGAARFRSALPGQIKALAAEFVKDMRLMWKRRREIARRGEQVRAHAEAAAATEPGTAVQVVAIDLSDQTLHDGLCLYVEYWGTNEALRPGVLLDYVPWDRELGAHSGPIHGPANHRWNEENREALAEKGADGRIDDLARALAAVAPGGPEAMLARLGSEPEVTVSIPTRNVPLVATFYWRSGVIECEVSMPGHLITFGDHVEVYAGHMPTTVAIDLPGRRFCDVVATPFGWDSIIVDVTQISSGFRFTLDQRTQLVDTATGRIWPE